MMRFGVALAASLWAGGAMAQDMWFQALDEFAIIDGVIGRDTPYDFEDFIAENPQVTTLVFYDVPGSEDDDANFELARMVHALGLNTRALARSYIASGGVDLFLAGRARVADCGAEFGVHTWADEFGVEGRDLPRDDPAHAVYVDFFADIGVDPAFYWWTLDVAAFDDMHYMTPGDMARFDLLTEPVTCD